MCIRDSNKADGPLFAGAETAGRGIGGVAQLRNGLVDLLLGLTGDIAGVVDGCLLYTSEQQLLHFLHYFLHLLESESFRQKNLSLFFLISPNFRHSPNQSPVLAAFRKSSVIIISKHF